MRLLTGNEISSILRDLTPDNARRLLQSLSSGLADFTAQESSSSNNAKIIHQPLRSVIQTKDRNTVLVMPVSNTATTSVKVATVPQKGDIAGAITIYNSLGQLQGVLNAAEITAFRTALAAMTILTRWQAPKTPQVIVFGAGKQAEWHVRLALLLIPGVRKVTVVNRGRERLGRFENSVIKALREAASGVQFECIVTGNDQTSSFASQLSEADIICCCTPSTEPLFAAKDLNPNAGKRRFLSLIGSYKPEMQEIDTETLKLGGKIWVDSKEACAEEAGELIRAKIGHEDLMEIGNLFSDDPDGNTKVGSEAQLTIFKCVGMGLMDLTIASALLEIAGDMGKGMVLDDF